MLQLGFFSTQLCAAVCFSGSGWRTTARPLLAMAAFLQWDFCGLSLIHSPDLLISRSLLSCRALHCIKCSLSQSPDLHRLCWHKETTAQKFRWKALSRNHLFKCCSAGTRLPRAPLQNAPDVSHPNLRCTAGLSGVYLTVHVIYKLPSVPGIVRHTSSFPGIPAWVGLSDAFKYIPSFWMPGSSHRAIPSLVLLLCLGG